MRYLVFLFSVLFGIISMKGDPSRPNQIHIEHVPNHGTHFEFPVPADKPTVYYDTENKEIIIDGPGYANYYDVDIESVSTGYVLISEVVNGYYDSIDVSSLPADDYTITITSSNNNVFEGSFCIEE